MSFAELQNQHTRAIILRLLTKRPGYQANDSLLSSMLADAGQPLSHDVLRSQLAWLAEQGLITTKTLMETMLVASLTTRGQDVALGLALVPGVKRPAPEDI
jgi:hypothetical protein